MAYMPPSSMVMAYIVMAYNVMADIAMAYVVTALMQLWPNIVMALI